MLTCVCRILPPPKFPFRAAFRTISVLPKPKAPAMAVLDADVHRPKVAVRNVPTEEFIDLTLRFGEKQRLFNFHRSKEEAVGRTLERMSQNLTEKIRTKIHNRKKRKSTSEEKESSEKPEQKTEPSKKPEQKTEIALTAPVQIALRVNDAIVSPQMPNLFAFVEGAELLLDQRSYKIVVNPPSILTGKITTHILPDFPIDCSLEFEFAEEDESLFVWLKHVVGTRSPANQVPREVEAAAQDSPISLPVIQEVVLERMKPVGAWRIVSLEREWTPTKEDVGAPIGLLCFPIKNGKVGDAFTTVAKNLIMSGLPDPVPFRRRHEHCRSRCGPDGFRVISYNLLADAYGAMESSLKELFPFCPVAFMKTDFRRQLARQEILGYNADVICLQEVDTKLFDNYFHHHFRRKGYEGVLQRKKGTISEGVATFFRTEKFRLLSQNDVIISDALFENPIFSKIATAINQKEKLKTTLQERGTPLQVSVLESKEDPSRILVVANTHLWFRPHFPHVRLLQMAVIVGHLEEVVRQIKTSRNLERDPALLICGDFNSTAGRGVHRFLRTGVIPRDFPEWKEFCKEESEYVEMELQHAFQLYSACGELSFTNYVPAFKAAIDWIYADSASFETVSVIPLPTEEELSANTAIPSAVFPSDHIAIGCDLKWKQ